MGQLAEDVMLCILSSYLSSFRSNNMSAYCFWNLRFYMQIQATLKIVLCKQKNHFQWFCLAKVAGASGEH